MSQYSMLAPYYDLLTADVDYAGLADYYEKIFAERGKKADTLLDLGCGTGSLTLELSGRGYDMIGADSSPDMLLVAREKLADEDFGSKPPPLLLCQPMEELDLYGTVSGAVCSLDGINYVPGDRLKRVFERLRLFIEPGGLFIFDILDPRELIDRDGLVSIDESEDFFCLWRTQYHESRRAVTHEVDLFVSEGELWRREQEEHIEHLHEPGDLAKLLTELGFMDIELRTDGPIDGEGRIFIIAENSGGQI